MAATHRMVLSEALGLATDPQGRFLKAPVFGSRSRCESRSTSADSSPQKSSAHGTPRLPACFAPPGLEDYGSPATSDIVARGCPFGMPPGLVGMLDFMLDAEAVPPPSHAPTLPPAGGPAAPPPMPAPPAHEAPVFSEKDLMPPPPPISPTSCLPPPAGWAMADGDHTPPPPPFSPGAAGMPPPPAGWASAAVAPPPLESAPVLEDTCQMPPPPARSPAGMGRPAGTAAPPGLDAPLSVGSAGHFAGLCKPCAFWHSKGCGNGAQCPFCHLCPPGEKQRRKSARKQLARLVAPHGQLEWGAR